MSVKINAVLVCSLSLLLSACSGRASAPGSAETLKYRLKWIRYFAIIKRVPILHPVPMPHAIWRESVRLSSLT